ncbi:MAG: 2-oxoacid:acceptor oxidoreductase family protein, partial [Eggerthellaceae bacterium]|nr:2-oxoacid:acceptor oxidoreductase family protein [Eggerthellaceae bacterium]
DPRILSVDADGISQEILGRAIPNTVLLGALSVLCDDVRREDLIRAIEGYMPKKLHQKNFEVVDAAIEAVEGSL